MYVSIYHYNKLPKDMRVNNNGFERETASSKYTICAYVCVCGYVLVYVFVILLKIILFAVNY